MNMTANSVLFSYLYNEFCLQTYLSFGLPKRITKELTKNRIRSHDLLIERGRYFRPKIPRKERKGDVCQIVEEEEHFMCFFCFVFFLFFFILSLMIYDQTFSRSYVFLETTRS